MRRLLFILSAIIAITAIAAPVRSGLGDTNTDFDGYIPPENLWVWPSEMVEPPRTLSPQYVWTPQLNAYYGFIAGNGYCQKGRAPLGSFTEDSFTTRYTAGYSLGVFVALEPGEYSIDFDSDAAGLASFIGYEEVDGGFLYNSRIFLTYILSAGHTHEIFFVPDWCGMAMLQISPTNSANPPTTVTNIELYRLD